MIQVNDTGRVSFGMKIWGLLAVVFGALTVMSGGQVLFGGAEARAAAGNAVPFVVWFNFLAGFAYAATGVGLLARQKWAAAAAMVIAVATVLAFAAFGFHVLTGGAFEMRTVGAMALRSAFWIAAGFYAYRYFRLRKAS